MTKKEVESFLKLQPQAQSAYEEISILSKKKPDDPVNKFKLKFINDMLSIANELLGDSLKPFPESFELFDDDDLPTNSDVVFMLVHYLECLEKLRCQNVMYWNYEYYWIINSKRSGIETSKPTKEMT